MAGKKLRSPFVTTASYLTAALTLIGGGVGCGGRVLESGGNGDSGTITPGEDANGSEVIESEIGPSPGCPATPPRGGACSTEGMNCDYSACYEPYWRSGEFAYCKGGEWQLGATSCNPPPPPPDPECPLTIFAGTNCIHPSWKVCSATISCSYDATSSHSDRFRCVDGGWVNDASYDRLPCPVLPPKHGASCACGTHPRELKCNYGDCYGSPTAYAYCDPSTNVWSVSQSTCNPPAPDYDGGYYPPGETGPAYDADRAE